MCESTTDIDEKTAVSQLVSAPIGLFLFDRIWTRMKDFPGTPGTLTGLLLRVSQFIFAAASIVFMAATNNFMNFTAFCYLVAAMSLQVIWSFGIAFLDSYSIVSTKVIDSPLLISILVIGDWATATLSLAAASASAAIAVLYFHDLGVCNIGAECQKFQLSVTSAFLSWFATAISSLIMLWIMA